ncbi:hypothetical protein BC834DRAFT_896714 [Gloeopeniophorella convolvens]|nr:hypothetical protein BC834DRAFT_896714 [Gloeopeniophorella convolvens]
MGATNKVAIITGAARGIGRGIALRLSEDGFAVAVNDLPNTPELDELVQEIEGQGRRAFAVPADVSVEGQVEQMIRKVVQELGSLDVMVANAGIFIVDSVLSATAEDFDRLMSVNARSTLLCYKYAGKQMIAQGRGGRIIGASSVAGKQALTSTPVSQAVASYSATKFAIRGLTQAAGASLFLPYSNTIRRRHTTAQEFGAHGITVNAYAPGAINTRMLNDFNTFHAEKLGPNAAAAVSARYWPVYYAVTMQRS